MTSGPRAINQESKILLRIDLRPPIPRRPRDIPHIQKVLKLRRLIPLITQQNNPIFLNARLLSSPPRVLQERFLCSQCLGAGVFQLECELLDIVAWVCGTNDSASPVCAPYYRGRVDAVGSVECEDVAFLPVPEGFETLAEVESGGAYLVVGVGAGRVGVGVDYCSQRGRLA